MLWGGPCARPTRRPDPSIDIGPAWRVPGVRAVLTADDVPGQLTYGLEPRRPTGVRDRTWCATRASRSPRGRRPSRGGPPGGAAIVVEYELPDRSSIPRRRSTRRRSIPTATCSGTCRSGAAIPTRRADRGRGHLRDGHAGPGVHGARGGPGGAGGRRRGRAHTSRPSGCTTTATRSRRASVSRRNWCDSRSAGSAARSGPARTSACRSTSACWRCGPAGRCKMVYSREESFLGHVHRHPARMWMRHTRHRRRAHRQARGPDPPRRRRLPVDELPRDRQRHVLRDRPLPGAERVGRRVRGADQQPAVRGDAGIRRRAGVLRPRGPDGPAGGGLRARSGGAAAAQRHAAGRPAAHRPGASTAPCRRRECIRAAASPSRCRRPPRGRCWPGRGARAHDRRGHVRRGIGLAVGFKNLMYAEGSDDCSTARCRWRTDSPRSRARRPKSGRASSPCRADRPHRARRRRRDARRRPTRQPSARPAPPSASRQTWMSGGAVEAACLAVRSGARARRRDHAGVPSTSWSSSTGELASVGGTLDVRVAEAAPGVVFEETEEYHHRLTASARRRRPGRRPRVVRLSPPHRAVVDVDAELGTRPRGAARHRARTWARRSTRSRSTVRSRAGIAQGVGLAVMEESSSTRAGCATRLHRLPHPDRARHADRRSHALIEEPEPGAPFGAKGVGEAADHLVDAGDRRRDPGRHRAGAVHGSRCGRRTSPSPPADPAGETPGRDEPASKLTPPTTRPGRSAAAETPGP